MLFDLIVNLDKLINLYLENKEQLHKSNFHRMQIDNNDLKNKKQNINKINYYKNQNEIEIANEFKKKSDINIPINSRNLNIDIKINETNNSIDRRNKISKKEHNDKDDKKIQSQENSEDKYKIFSLGYREDFDLNENQINTSSLNNVKKLNKTNNQTSSLQKTSYDGYYFIIKNSLDINENIFINKILRNKALSRFILTESEQLFEQKYIFFEDDEIEESRFIIRYKLKILKENNYFGDLALDSEKKKRTATIKAGKEGCILGYISKDVYYYYIYLKKEKIFQNDLRVLNNHHIFNIIEPNTFEKYYFPFFEMINICKNEIIQLPGDDLDNILIIRSGKIDFSFKANIFEIHNLIKFIIEKLKILKLIDNNTINLYEEKFIKNISFKEFKLNEDKKKLLENNIRTVHLFYMSIGEIIGLDPFILGTKAIFQAKAQSEKVKVYKLNIENLRKIIKNYPECKDKFMNITMGKIYATLKRLNTIKVSLLDVFESHYNQNLKFLADKEEEYYNRINEKKNGKKQKNLFKESEIVCENIIEMEKKFFKKILEYNEIEFRRSQEFSLIIKEKEKVYFKKNSGKIKKKKLASNLSVNSLKNSDNFEKTNNNQNEKTSIIKEKDNNQNNKLKTTFHNQSVDLENEVLSLIQQSNINQSNECIQYAIKSPVVINSVLLNEENEIIDDSNYNKNEKKINKKESLDLNSKKSYSDNFTETMNCINMDKHKKENFKIQQGIDSKLQDSNKKYNLGKYLNIEENIKTNSDYKESPIKQKRKNFKGNVEILISNDFDTSKKNTDELHNITDRNWIGSNRKIDFFNKTDKSSIIDRQRKNFSIYSSTGKKNSKENKWLGKNLHISEQTQTEFDKKKVPIDLKNIERQKIDFNKNVIDRGVKLVFGNDSIDENNNIKYSLSNDSQKNIKTEEIVISENTDILNEKEKIKSTVYNTFNQNSVKLINNIENFSPESKSQINNNRHFDIEKNGTNNKIYVSYKNVLNTNNRNDSPNTKKSKIHNNYNEFNIKNKSIPNNKKNALLILKNQIINRQMFTLSKKIIEKDLNLNENMIRKNPYSASKKKVNKVKNTNHSIFSIKELNENKRINQVDVFINKKNRNFQSSFSVSLGKNKPNNFGILERIYISEKKNLNDIKDCIVYSKLNENNIINIDKNNSNNLNSINNKSSMITSLNSNLTKVQNIFISPNIKILGKKYENMTENEKVDEIIARHKNSIEMFNLNNCSKVINTNFANVTNNSYKCNFNLNNTDFDKFNMLINKNQINNQNNNMKSKRCASMNISNNNNFSENYFTNKNQSINNNYKISLNEEGNINYKNQQDNMNHLNQDIINMNTNSMNFIRQPNLITKPNLKMSINLGNSAQGKIKPIEPNDKKELNDIKETYTENVNFSEHEINTKKSIKNNKEKEISILNPLTEEDMKYKEEEVFQLKDIKFNSNKDLKRVNSTIIDDCVLKTFYKLNSTCKKEKKEILWRSNSFLKRDTSCTNNNLFNNVDFTRFPNRSKSSDFDTDIISKITNSNFLFFNNPNNKFLSSTLSLFKKTNEIIKSRANNSLINNKNEYFTNSFFNNPKPINNSKSNISQLSELNKPRNLNNNSDLQNFKSCNLNNISIKNVVNNSNKKASKDKKLFFPNIMNLKDKLINSKLINENILNNVQVISTAQTDKEKIHFLSRNIHEMRNRNNDIKIKKFFGNNKNKMV